ncbi:hypothetical protein MIND_01166200 [Mycena indigotica]|uniref:Uncharacterized protein n=1 Tax=Mycena indigotica TaxID=2126181 RepID=A0A8H6S5N4_9AGAR|nr:uncharacterized protein MIND_01166200 [Mycena indigotica]KAF7292680.1 hypothetical protein MIND_01166200 [Mycena indigotica]
MPLLTQHLNGREASTSNAPSGSDSDASPELVSTYDLRIIGWLSGVAAVIMLYIILRYCSLFRRHRARKPRRQTHKRWARMLDQRWTNETVSLPAAIPPGSPRAIGPEAVSDGESDRNSMHMADSSLEMDDLSWKLEPESRKAFTTPTPPSGPRFDVPGLDIDDFMGRRLAIEEAAQARPNSVGNKNPSSSFAFIRIRERNRKRLTTRMAKGRHTYPPLESSDSSTSLLSGPSSAQMPPESRRRSWARWTNIISIILHIGLVLAHVVLLALALHHVEHRIAFPIARQSIIAFLVTSLLTGWSIIYLTAAVFVTQRLATLLNIHSRQTLTATNDNIASWGGLGSSLLSIYRQRTISAAVGSSFAIALYLGGISMLQISTPALVSVAGFNGTQFSGIVSTLGLPDYANLSLENPGAGAFVGFSATFFPWMSNLNETHRVGLFNGSIYETVNHAANPDLPLGIANVWATGFEINCGYLPGSVNKTSGDSWAFDLGGDGGIHNKSSLYTTGPNITLFNPTIGDTPANAIILFTTNKIIDSSGRTPDAGVVHLDKPMRTGDLQIDQVQFLLCTRELVRQHASISLQDNQIDSQSLNPSIHKTRSTWRPYTDVWSLSRPIYDVFNNVTSLVESDAWASLMDGTPDSSVPLGVSPASSGLSTASLFLMERLNLEPTWLLTGNNTRSDAINSVRPIYLHEIENALSELVATIFWMMGHITADPLQMALSSVTTVGPTRADMLLPTLQTGAGTAKAYVLQARLELNIIAVSIGLAASALVCALALRYALRTNEESVLQRAINAPGLLQTMWLAEQHAGLHEKLVQIHKPSNERLRRAAMVSVKLAQDKEGEALRDFPKEPGPAADRRKPLYSRTDQLICLALHVVLILVHAILLGVLLNHHAEHRITYPLARQRSMSLWVTIISTGLGTLYLAFVLFLTQRAALKRLLDIRQPLSATHDQVSSWNGLGAALAAILNQFTLPTAINGTLAVLLYLGVLALLHVTIPSMLSVQAFNQTTIIPVTTLGQPLWASEDNANNGSAEFLKDIGQFMVWRDTLNDSMVGLWENTLYDVLEEGISTVTNPSRFVEVTATAFNVTCGFPEEVTSTKVALRDRPNISWNLSVKVENGESIWFLPPPSGPNILTSFPMVPGTFSEQTGVRSAYVWPSLILYTTASVVDSFGNSGPSVKFAPGSLDGNGTVPSLQLIRCSRSLVNQEVTVDTITRLLNSTSLTPSVRKTSSKWSAYSDPAPGISVTERVTDPRGPLESGLWPLGGLGSFVPLTLVPDEFDTLSLMDLFVMDKLKLNPSWLKTNNTASSPIQTVQLHNLENALADFAASFFWVAGHIELPRLESKYQFTDDTSPSRSTFKNSKAPVLQRKTVTVEMNRLAARVELNLIAVFAGLLASLVSLVIAFKLVWHNSQSGSSRGGGITTLNILQIVWLFRNNPQLAGLELERVATPTEDNLRAAGMVEAASRNADTECENCCHIRDKIYL